MSSAADSSRITSVTDVLPDLPHIPDVPAVPAVEPSVLAEAVASVGAESSLTALGLGGWSPIGMVQQTLEYFHIGMDLPWWGAIALGTVIVRFLMFPLVVVAQRNAAKMNNHLPQMQMIQLKLTEARQSGNKIEAMRYTQELMAFMKEKQLNPLKSMIVPLAQAPLFISFFVGLRRMANAPVESMATGGTLWFLDLTVPDPYYLLPIITSATFYLTIELGTDTARLSSQNMQTMKYVLRAMPLLIIPFTLNFPGAILTYWACSNFISLGQVGFLKIPAVRQFFKIDKMVVHKQDTLPMKKKGFVEGIKDCEWRSRRRYFVFPSHRSNRLFIFTLPAQRGRT